MTKTTATPAPADTDKKVRLVLWILMGAIIAAGLVWYAVFAMNRPAPAAPQAAATAQLVREDSHRLTSPAVEKAQLVEFLDFECESCRAAHPLVEELKQEYGDRITFVNRYFPLTGHRNSGTAALAVEASAQQGKYQQMAAKLLKPRTSGAETGFPGSRVPELRAGTGLDLAKYDAAVADEATLERIRKDAADGTALGVTGTPTFFLNGKKLVLNTEAEFRQLLSDAAE